MEFYYTILLAGLLAGSVYTDLRWHLIKNVLVFPAMIIGLIMRYIDAGLPGLSYGFKGLLFGFLMVFIPYLIIDGLGEGDVKLVAAIGVFTGPQHVIWAAFFASIYGVLISMIISAKEKKLKQMFSFTINHSSLLVLKFLGGDLSRTEIEDPGTKIAYAVPITLGVITASFLVGW